MATTARTMTMSTSTTSATTTTTRAYTQANYTEPEKVFLRPRPYARYAGYFVLVPLLPKRTPLKPLPAEVWRKVIRMVIEYDEGSYREWSLNTDDQARTSRKGKGLQWSKWDLVLVCKNLKNIALPILYEHSRIPSLVSLANFTAHLHSSEQKWDSIRRIPYSTPGRWVLSLDLSELEITSLSETCTADALLTTLYPLLPFLTRLELSLSLQLSRRAMMSLGLRDGAQNLRFLSGVKYDASTVISGDDPLTELVACCSNLEELEVVGLGVDDIEMTIATNGPVGDFSLPTFSRLFFSPPPSAPLYLPRLHTLTLLATPTSPLLMRLVHSPLPALTSVVITPYGNLPSPQSLVTQFLTTHGQNVLSLVLHTPNSWPTVRFSPPTALLRLLPNLRALSLENTGLALDAPPTDAGHPLTALWIARPTPGVRAELLRVLPRLPHLREVRARDVRWARRSMSAQARAAGFQGEMCAWRSVLAPYGIRMLDADGHEDAED